MNHNHKVKLLATRKAGSTSGTSQNTIYEVFDSRDPMGDVVKRVKKGEFVRVSVQVNFPDGKNTHIVIDDAQDYAKKF